jgi:hypothetical protein
VRCQAFVVGADICTVLPLPEWPTAATALLRLITALGSSCGLYNVDNTVRQVSVDMLGTIAARVFMEATLSEKEEEYLKDCLLKEVGGILPCCSRLPVLPWGCICAGE